MLTPSGNPNEHPYWYGTKIVEKNPCKRSGACYFDRVLKENHNLSVGPDGEGEQFPPQHTSGPSAFSGLKVAEAAGSPVAAADTNGDGLICPGVTKLKPVTGSSDGERLKSAAGPIYDGHTIGVRPPGQTEGEHTRHAVRGFDTAFTRNSSPVGLAFHPNYPIFHRTWRTS